MAVVSPAPEITQQVIPINLPGYRVPGNMAATRKKVKEPVAPVIKEKIYVAVGKNLRENKSLLTWALQRSEGKKICILHVHQPAQMIPTLMGPKFHASTLEEGEVKAYREFERQDMHKILYEYHLLCWRMGVETEKLHIETDLSIEKGILELISELGIRKLVMGAAADKRYSKNMNIKSKKAISVLRQAPAYCHIWFICKQHLIYTKEGTWDANGAELRSSPQQVSPNTETEQSNHLTSKSNILERKNLPNPALESQIADADLMVKELEQKITSSEELLQNYKKERDELQIERDNSLKEAEELRHIPQFSEFSFSEIEEATQNFNPSLKIGEGGYGNIYKGLLGHRQVAIKVLSSHSSQGPAEYQQEVGVLSKMRHRNLITLIGACPETWTLIYEYLPNGSLEDRLNCRDNSPPLSWQTRIRIATELCSVLIFLHSSKPHCIVHADLKPANILLDANFVSKLSDFGISHQLSQNEGSSICWRTVPKGTIPYMDPEFLTSGELTPKSDVYSFGIILLRLLTGRPAFGITKEVQYALDKGNLKILLDPLAGDWPFVQAEQLVHLALRCCDMNRKSRPDLASEVGRVLESMRASCGGSSCFRGEVQKSAANLLNILYAQFSRK